MLIFFVNSIDISQFIYFYSKWFLLCHKLFKYKPHCDLQSKVSWYSDFKIFTSNLLSLYLIGKKHKISDSGNDVKQNRYEFACASSIIKCLEDMEKNDKIKN